MGDLPPKLEALVKEIAETVRKGESISPEVADRLYQQVNFDRAGISLQQLTWLCWQRPAEVSNFCQGKAGFKDLKESIIIDETNRSPVGYYKDGRSGLG